MPIYMDLHIIPGVKAKDVANAHLMDIMMQKEHKCTCMTYWIDEARGHVFCLIDAPSKEVVTELHDRAHGLVPHKIIEVQTSLVESFLGRVNDPEDAEITEEGLKLITDPSYRYVVMVQSDDIVLMSCRDGKEKANGLREETCRLISRVIMGNHGRVVEHSGPNAIASFTTAGKAVDCAFELQKELRNAGLTYFKIAVDGGEPVTNNGKLYGDTIEKAERMCFVVKNCHIALSYAVYQSVNNDTAIKSRTAFHLSMQDELLMSALFEALEKNWQNGDFNLDHYSTQLAMSRSGLYRKTVAITGLSPNALLKEFRLHKVQQELKRKISNISQITFDAGFSSPSYFTKCFKRKFGVLPGKYLEMVE